MGQTDARKVTERIIASGKAAYDQMVAWRRSLHQVPEVGWHEEKTTELICQALDEMGIEWERPLATGCVATLRGRAADAYDATGHARRRLLMRADIDALPVEERTGLDFSSRHEGFMHACGHDFHAAMLLGAARVLSDMADDLHGEVRLVFQPSEEISEGADAMIKRAHVCEGVDGAYGVHIWSDVPFGKVSCEAGPRMANTDWFRIDIRGASAHGAMPHHGTDAIVCAAELVGALQTVVSRRLSPFEPSVVTIGEIHGGTANNVIADHVYMRGTIRSFSLEAHDLLLGEVDRLTQGIAAAHGCEGHFCLDGQGSLAVVNDAACAELCARSAEKVLGADALFHYEGSMPGEDFSEYQHVVPGVFVFVGAGTCDKDGVVWPQHSAHYSPREEALLSGALLGAQYAIDFLSQG